MANERKNNLFKQVPAPRVGRNLFDLSHEVKMSGKFGYLYPVLCIDTMPGDVIRDTMNCMVRFAPMLAPVMHRCDVTTHFFFVPNRIIWDNWQSFITGGQDGTEAPVPPFVTPATIGGGGGDPDLMRAGSLWDYLGLPVLGATGAFDSTEPISVLPFRACGKVFNDFYRDPNLGIEFDLGEELDGSVGALVATRDYMFLGNYRRGFEKDYFTSALPWAQRGAQVLMPLGTDITYADPTIIRHPTNPTDTTPFTVSGTGGLPDPESYMDGGTGSVIIENIESIEGNTTINDFRRSLAIQRWLEANARGGGRYTEQIEGHFNVRVPDYRLQRAEYLGGGRQPVSISEVLATANDDVSSPGNVAVGEMFGHGISVGRTNQFSYRCEEHGWLVGFLSVTMRTAYSQGIPKKWLRSDKFDFGWPELANLGEQEILSKEVFYSFDIADAAANDAVFGYIPRYAEYKFENDRIAGDFRDTLGFWHLGRNFTQRPSLDVAFTTIYENGDGGSGVESDEEETFRRIFNVVDDSVDYLWMQLYHRLTAKRPLPYFGVPSI